MVKVIVGNNVKKEEYNARIDETLRNVIDATGIIDLTSGSIHLDGATLKAGDLNKTFAELGYDGSPDHDHAFLLSVVNAKNA